MKIFKLILGLDTTREDPEFEWIEYFSTKKRMLEYVKKYEHHNNDMYVEPKKCEDWDYETIELDKPEGLTE